MESTPEDTRQVRRAPCREVRITAADTARGVPTAARCDCGATWTQPAGDRWSDSLPVWARTHLAVEEGATVS